MPSIIRRYIIDDLRDGKWIFAVVSGDYDLTKGLPSDRETFDTKDEATQALVKRLQADGATRD